MCFCKLELRFESGAGVARAWKLEGWGSWYVVPGAWCPVPGARVGGQRLRVHRGSVGDGRGEVKGEVGSGGLGVGRWALGAGFR